MAVNFLNNADIDGKNLPPAGAPNIIMATGGTQQKKILEDDGIFAWKFHVIGRIRRTRKSPARKRSPSLHIIICAMDSSPTACHSRTRNRGSTRRAIRSWRGSSIAGLVTASQLSLSTRSTLLPEAAACAVYEFRVGKDRRVSLYQQGTYAPRRVLPLDG